MSIISTVVQYIIQSKKTVAYYHLNLVKQQLHLGGKIIWSSGFYAFIFESFSICAKMLSFLKVLGDLGGEDFGMRCLMVSSSALTLLMQWPNATSITW